MNYITYVPAVSTTIAFEGYSFNWTTNVFLSANSLTNMQPITSINNTKFGAFSGTWYYNYNIIDENRLNVYLANLNNPGLYDIIVYNIAGFAKLSDKGYLIKVL